MLLTTVHNMTEHLITSCIVYNILIKVPYNPRYTIVARLTNWMVEMLTIFKNCVNKAVTYKEVPPIHISATAPKSSIFF